MYGQNTADKPIPFIRSAFTQIELIFVIVTVGILAAVALPRFTQTASNAKLAIDVSNMSTCIRETASYYALYRTYPPVGFTATCDDIICYTISTNDVNFTVATNSAADGYCANVETVGGHLAKSYQF